MYFCVLKVAAVQKCRDVSLISSSKAGLSSSSSFKRLLQTPCLAFCQEWWLQSVRTCNADSFFFCAPNAWVFSSWQVLDPAVPNYRTKNKMLVQNNVCQLFGYLLKRRTKINKTILYVPHGYIKEGFTTKQFIFTETKNGRTEFVMVQVTIYHRVFFCQIKKETAVVRWQHDASSWTGRITAFKSS